MVLRTEAEIARLVAVGCHEKALEVGFDATTGEVARAHLRQLHLFSGSERTRESLNRAKTVLTTESAERKIQRLVQIDELNQALRVAKKHFAPETSPGDCYTIGYILYRMDRYVEASQYLAQAFERSETPFYSVWLGMSLERQGKREEALGRYVWAIEQRGNETEYRLAGNLLFHLGEFEKARVHLQKAVSMGCGDEDVLEKLNTLEQKRKMRGIARRICRWFARRRPASR